MAQINLKVSKQRQVTFSISEVYADKTPVASRETRALLPLAEDVGREGFDLAEEGLEPPDLGDAACDLAEPGLLPPAGLELAVPGPAEPGLEPAGFGLAAEPDPLLEPAPGVPLCTRSLLADLDLGRSELADPLLLVAGEGALAAVPDGGREDLLTPELGREPWLSQTT